MLRSLCAANAKMSNPILNDAPRAERRHALARLADGAGVLGAVFAAFCCAGTAFIVSGLGLLGLSFLRRDAILWPLMIGSLALAMWGFVQGRSVHGKSGPLLLGAAGAVSLAAGVIVVHGFPAIQMIDGGAIALVLATIWNVASRRACAAGR